MEHRVPDTVMGAIEHQVPDTVNRKETVAVGCSTGSATSTATVGLA